MSRNGENASGAVSVRENLSPPSAGAVCATVNAYAIFTRMMGPVPETQGRGETRNFEWADF